MRKNKFCTFTLILALAIAALPASLAAAGTGTASASSQSLPVQQNMTLTITPGSTSTYNPDGSSFTAYRVMSFTQGTDGNWVWAAANGFTYPGTGEFNPDAFGSYSAAKLQNLAAQLALQINDTMSDKLDEQALSNGSCSWTTNKAGIWLVVETATRAGNFPSEPFLVALPYTDPQNQNSWLYSLTASPKGSAVGLDKVIHEAKGSYLNEATYEGDKDTVANGDTVKYLITTKIPAYTSVYFGEGKNPTFRLVDTMAKGLTLTQSTVSLTCGGQPMTAGTDYSQSVTTNDDGTTTLTISLAGTFLSVAAHHNQELVLSYNAVVNDHVSLASAGNENTVTLHYSYDPLNPTDTKEIEDDARVYSFGIEIEKFDGDTDGTQKTMLEGAQFALYKETAKGCTAAQALSQEPYREVGVTDEHGILDFTGLDAGTYYLKEVKAPSGYSLLMNPIKVEIIPSSTTGEHGEEVINDGSFTVEVNDTAISAGSTQGVSRILTTAGQERTIVVAAANHVGFSLPMTGGTGIALILVLSLAGLTAVTWLYVKGYGGKKTHPRQEQ